jgi:hypothetical protein
MASNHQAHIRVRSGDFQQYWTAIVRGSCRLKAFQPDLIQFSGYNQQTSSHGLKACLCSY